MTDINTKASYNTFTDFRHLWVYLASVLRCEGQTVYISRLKKETIEAQFCSFVVSAKVDETIKIASEPWFERFAETRINYMEDVFQPQLIDICEILDNDPGSRRAYIPNFDWYWEGHDPCNMLYHFLLRDNVLSLTVVLRSSDVYKVLPLDLKAACYFLKFINSELNSAYALERPVTIGDIRFLVSSLHIYSDDKLAFEKEIRNEH